MACDNHGQIESGIELLEFIEIHFGQKGRRLHVDVAALCDPHEVGGVFNLRKLHAVLFGMRHDFLHGHELWHIPRRLPRHLEVTVVRRAVTGLGALDGAGDAAFAPVVGGKRQLPVAKALMEPHEVVQGRAGAFQNVAPLVLPEILLQRVDGAGSRHELPQARGLGVRKRFGLEGAFNERQKRELRGHAARFDFFDDVVEVLAGAIRDATEVVGIAGVLIESGLLALGVECGERKALTDAVPDVGGGAVFGCGASLDSGLVVGGLRFVVFRGRGGRRGRSDDGLSKLLRGRQGGRNVVVERRSFKLLHALCRRRPGRKTSGEKEKGEERAHGGNLCNGGTEKPPLYRGVAEEFTAKNRQKAVMLTQRK